MITDRRTPEAALDCLNRQGYRSAEPQKAFALLSSQQVEIGEMCCYKELNPSIILGHYVSKDPKELLVIRPKNVLTSHKSFYLDSVPLTQRQTDRILVLGIRN